LNIINLRFNIQKQEESKPKLKRDNDYDGNNNIYNKIKKYILFSVALTVEFLGPVCGIIGST
jgi:hypothetical protein